MRYQALKRLILLFLDRGWREWRIELGVELGAYCSRGHTGVLW